MLASQDRKHTRDYIAEQNLMAAVALDERISDSAGSRAEDTRELVIHPHFVLVYEMDKQWGKVYILRVLHTAQKCAIIVDVGQYKNNLNGMFRALNWPSDSFPY